MITSRQELNNQIDMLKGNINRMCITDSVEELDLMYYTAMKRLDDIHLYNSVNLNNVVK